MGRRWATYGISLAVGWAGVARGEAAPGYDEAMNGLRRALRAGELAEAQRRCAEARKAASEPKFGGPRTAAAYAACGRVELASDRPASAARRFRQAAHAAVHDPRARRRHLAARRRAAFKARRRREAALVTQLLRFDAAAQTYLRRSQRRGAALATALSTLDQAESAYRKDGDRQQVRLVAAVRALLLARSERHPEALVQVKRILRYPVAARVERTALEAAFYAHTAAGALQDALDAAIRMNAITYADEPEAKRRYGRTRVLTRACRAYDAEGGAGACVRRQLDLVGYAALRDYAGVRPKKALLAADLDRVHADALPTLEQCVLHKARDDRERYRGVDLRFSWTIHPDGHPEGIEVKPSRYAEAMKSCVDDAVAWFRYPRSSPNAERTNVMIPYRLD